MNEGFILNVPIVINGGKGVPSHLEDRELYIDTDTSILYYGNEDGEVNVISIGDMTSMVTAILKSGVTCKELNNFVLKNPAKDTLLDSMSELSGKQAGVYFVKM